jgi:hypothetical protein
MAKNEDIYKVIIDYIQEDNRWKESMNKQVASIEYQTKQTNGRLLKVEAQVTTLDTDHIRELASKTTNWRWVLGILAGIQFLFAGFFSLFITWAKDKLS